MENQSDVYYSKPPARELDIMKCLSEGWDYFKLNAGLIIGATVAFYAVVIILNLIPVLGFITYIIISPALFGGYIYFLINVARNSNPRFEDMFAGFSSKFLTLFGAYWLMGLMYVALMLPTIIIYLLLAGGFSAFGQSIDPSIVFALGVTYLINIIIVIVIMIRFYFAYYVIMDYDNIGVIDSLKKSAELMRGNLWKVVLYGIVSALIVLAGFICLIIPGIIACFVTVIGYARIYITLKEIHGEGDQIQSSTPPPPYSAPPPETNML